MYLTTFTTSCLDPFGLGRDIVVIHLASAPPFQKLVAAGTAREKTMRELDANRLLKASELLGETVIDPAVWPQAMDEICRAVSATGAVLLQSDNRTSDVPRTASVDDIINQYFRGGWHLRDVRADRGVPKLLRGERVLIDQDLFSANELLRDTFYNEYIAPMGLKWFAAIGFSAGPALWGLSIQRTPDAGPFGARDKKILAALSLRLTEVASLATVIGRTAISGATNALNHVRVAAVAIDRFGHVLDANQAAEALYGGQIDVRNRRLVVGDRTGNAALAELLDRLRITPDTQSLEGAKPIVIRRGAKWPVVIRALPVHGAARTPFLGARALLTFTPIKSRPGPKGELLATVFGLTAAEAKLASLLAGGATLEQAAEQIGIARATARNQLKAVFAKTDTHRQSQLVAVLANL
jgi:DNA-binding CsgD family transcriptional regulator